MKTRILLRSAIVASFLAIITPTLRAATVSVEETFDNYGNEEDLQRAWRMLWGGKAKAVKKWAEGGTQLSLKNRVVVYELPGEITQSFKLCARVLHSQQNRVQWLGLLSDDMTKGYILLWDSYAADGAETRGQFKLYKINASARELIEIIMRPEWSRELVRAYAPDGISTDKFPNAITEPAPTLCLSWSKENGQLIGSCNGSEFLDTSDTEISSFRYIVLGGNDTGLFDDIKLIGE